MTTMTMTNQATVGSRAQPRGVGGPGDGRPARAAFGAGARALRAASTTRGGCGGPGTRAARWRCSAVWTSAGPRTARSGGRSRSGWASPEGGTRARAPCSTARARVAAPCCGLRRTACSRWRRRSGCGGSPATSSRGARSGGFGRWTGAVDDGLGAGRPRGAQEPASPRGYRRGGGGRAFRKGQGPTGRLPLPRRG